MTNRGARGLLLWAPERPLPASRPWISLPNPAGGPHNRGPEPVGSQAGGLALGVGWGCSVGELCSLAEGWLHCQPSPGCCPQLSAVAAENGPRPAPTTEACLGCRRTTGAGSVPRSAAADVTSASALVLGKRRCPQFKLTQRAGEACSDSSVNYFLSFFSDSSISGCRTGGGWGGDTQGPGLRGRCCTAGRGGSGSGLAAPGDSSALRAGVT